ncbi:DUF3124 domain-containing protein [Neolewinella lacunae]|uniref:DUF3124 domain-containing protein n=1 Tax=Neolewinella lacunae TaxID=1517758 RepID=A0A923TES5_9BACT|nr:DUF3124 domain-containing protein [Neolewinella lacunae]MBC6996237.1 DUF3124 domain-containing protein [Neolewinella lacunae]MDN3634743.1 DUF3124 domain-containing protein [Neolewinella lacunae]
MRARLLLPILLLPLLFACQENREISSIDPVNWEKRTVSTPLPDSLERGSTYLSVYSQIYGETEHRTHNLTATVSMRNVNRHDTVYLDHAEYYGTTGALIRTYFQRPIYILPLETVEIVIDEIDKAGGTGANFLFDWQIRPGTNAPFFECVMISTSGQQGLSFTTRGVLLKR